MRDLHGRRIGVAVHGDGLHTEPLQLDYNLLAEFSGAEQQRLRVAVAVSGVPMRGRASSSDGTAALA